MASDKAIDSVKLESNLTSIADAIRSKGGTSDELAFPAGFVSAIMAIAAGSENDSSAYPVNIKIGSFTLESVITSEYTFRINETELINANRKVFALFRTSNTTERGIAMVVIYQTESNTNRKECTGGYVGGTGAVNWNMNDYSISTNSNFNGNIITITCSTTAPLSAHEYVWIELSVK